MVEAIALAGEKLPRGGAEVFVYDFNDSVLLGCGAGVFGRGVKHTDQQDIRCGLNSHKSEIRSLRS